MTCVQIQPTISAPPVFSTMMVQLTNTSPLVSFTAKDHPTWHMFLHLKCTTTIKNRKRTLQQLAQSSSIQCMMFQIRLYLNTIQLVTSCTLIIAHIPTRAKRVLSAEMVEITVRLLNYTITIQLLILTIQLGTFYIRTLSTIPCKIQ